MRLKVALQLYTMRDDINGDFIGMLEKVREAGYEGVEFAGYFGILADDLKKELDRIGLTPVSTHETFERVTGEADDVIAYNKVIGNKNIVVPYVQTNEPERLQEFITKMQAVEQKYADAGMVLSYHNHRHDFEKMDGEYCIEKFMKAVPSCQYEIDTYWTELMLDDVPGYIRQNKDRMALIHLKDGLGKDDPWEIRSIGEGNMDIQAILDVAKEIGLEWVIVENDVPKPDGFTSIKESFENLETKYTL